jgi:hypothetical protein
VKLIKANSFLITLIVAGASVASASTFVGNGGNVGDVELKTSIGQVSQTFGDISGNRYGVQTILCTCTDPYRGRALCEMLKNLSESQVRFCSKYLVSKAADVSRVLQEPGRLRISWSHEPMEVQEGTHLRAADAVTNIADMSMTLHQERFLAMTPQERAFLLGHEVFHLTTYESRPLTDDGPIGPFTGPEGKRQLINAMAASMVMMGDYLDVFKAKEDVLNRSQATKDFWVSLGYRALGPGYDHDNPYGVDRLNGAELGVRYQLSPNWGVIVGAANLEATRNRLTQIEGKETRRIYSAGVSYRWFPQQDPMTFWGQAHVVFSLTADHIVANYSLHSAHTGLEDAATADGFSVGARYLFPIQYGIWGFGGLSYSQQSFSFSQLFLDYKGGPSAILGASYGF